MSAFDAWLTTDVEYEKGQERADYCADNHDWDGEGECPECEAEDARYLEGPDPDDINDQRREREMEDNR